MKVNDFSLLIGGEAGAGISRSGFLFAKACMRGGLYVFGTNDYQSLIRGGHNFYTVRISDKPIYSQADRISLLVALNAETAMLHRKEFDSGSGVIYDSDDIDLNPKSLGRQDVALFPVPLRKIVLEELKEPHNLVMRNTVALGAVCAATGFDCSLLEEVLNETFKPEVAEPNVRAIRIGYDNIKQAQRNGFQYQLQRTAKAGKRLIFLTGNEAVALGAIKAGCKFYAAYPMTPSTGVLHFMASNERNFGIATIQPEGEIAAISMTVGAAFAGVRAMTSTSGGGFCLMSEGLGMAGMTETPVVVMVGQRPGPSTGLPTYMSQGDLLFAIHASQGEFPRIVIAPGDVEECFYETMRAFNWADRYQLPVILLADKYVLESEMAVEPFHGDKVGIDRGMLVHGEHGSNNGYGRYGITETGVSLRALPSTKGAIVRANSDEHDESGLTTEEATITVMMMEKRMRKLHTIAKEFVERNVETVKFYGSENAQATIVSWGSTKGPIREALRLLESQGIAVNFLQILYLHPFPKDRIKEVFDNAKKTIVVENNMTSQLSSLLRERLLRKPDHKVLKYDGRQFDPSFLVEKIKEVL